MRPTERSPLRSRLVSSTPRRAASAAVGSRSSTPRPTARSPSSTSARRRRPRTRPTSSRRRRSRPTRRRSIASAGRGRAAGRWASPASRPGSSSCRVASASARSPMPRRRPSPSRRTASTRASTRPRSPPLFKARVQTLPSLASSFLPGGQPAALGARIRRPELAATLLRFGAEGKKSIYEGPTAQKIVDAVARRRRHDDARGPRFLRGEGACAAHAHHRRPHRSTRCPRPRRAGSCCSRRSRCTARVARRALVPLGFGSSAYLHTVSEAMRGATADRARSGGDPDLDPRRRQGVRRRARSRANRGSACTHRPDQDARARRVQDEGAGDEPRRRRRRGGQRRVAHDHGERPVRREHRRRRHRHPPQQRARRLHVRRGRREASVRRTAARIGRALARVRSRA